MDSSAPRDPSEVAWIAVSSAFAALGRIFICLDGDFRVLHASRFLDQLYGAGTGSWVEGRRVEAILGEDLFGAEGPLRHALKLGERREGWRALLRLQDSTRLMSISVAALSLASDAGCDPRTLYIVVLRPAEGEPFPEEDGAPTAFHGLIARSASMGRIIRLIESLRHSEATVLLSGESGTGKEVVARAIHATSPRREGPFVAVNCGALPGELLESELFGHVRGAFTGATKHRVGRFELASSGTLFLDEVGDMPLHLQVSLLRVLQDHTFQRVGESETQRSEARIIAATNVDLRHAVQEGEFREDLYYRLRVLPIELPPLRQRREDIEPLARFLLARVTARQGRMVRFSPASLRTLLAYSWPGNVRELENALEYAVAVCQRQTLLPEDLPDEVRSEQATRDPPSSVSTTGETDKLETDETDKLTEAHELREALDRHNWRRAETARALGISRTTLWRKMRELDLIS
jgi:transcriptional regulator with PAS, ATPase and Fis domain